MGRKKTMKRAKAVVQGTRHVHVQIQVQIPTVLERDSDVI